MLRRSGRLTRPSQVKVEADLENLVNLPDAPKQEEGAGSNKTKKKVFRIPGTYPDHDEDEMLLYRLGDIQMITAEGIQDNPFPVSAMHYQMTKYSHARRQSNVTEKRRLAAREKIEKRGFARKPYSWKGQWPKHHRKGSRGAMGFVEQQEVNGLGAMSLHERVFRDLPTPETLKEEEIQPAKKRPVRKAPVKKSQARSTAGTQYKTSNSYPPLGQENTAGANVLTWMPPASQIGAYRYPFENSLSYDQGSYASYAEPQPRTHHLQPHQGWDYSPLHNSSLSLPRNFDDQIYLVPTNNSRGPNWNTDHYSRGLARQPFPISTALNESPTASYSSWSVPSSANSSFYGSSNEPTYTDSSNDSMSSGLFPNNDLFGAGSGFGLTHGSQDIRSGFLSSPFTSRDNNERFQASYPFGIHAFGDTDFLNNDLTFIGSSPNQNLRSSVGMPLESTFDNFFPPIGSGGQFHRNVAPSQSGSNLFQSSSFSSDSSSAWSSGFDSAYYLPYESVTYRPHRLTEPTPVHIGLPGYDSCTHLYP